MRSRRELLFRFRLTLLVAIAALTGAQIRQSLLHQVQLIVLLVMCFRKVAALRLLID